MPWRCMVRCSCGCVTCARREHGALCMAYGSEGMQCTSQQGGGCSMKLGKPFANPASHVIPLICVIYLSTACLLMVATQSAEGHILDGWPDVTQKCSCCDEHFSSFWPGCCSNGRMKT